MAKNPRIRKREYNFDAKKVNMTVMGLALVSALGLGGFSYVSTQTYQSAFNKNKAEIAKLEGDLKDLVAEGESVSVNKIQQTLNSATKLGESVVQLQNTWNEALTAEDQMAYNESDKQSAVELNKTRVIRLQSIFGSNSGQIGSTEWYPRINGTKSGTASWKFVTTMSFTSSKQNVMWQCLGADGELYAYATAVYDSKNDTFTDLSVAVTTLGIESQSVSVEGGQ